MLPATKWYLSLVEERAYMFDVPWERMSFGDRGVRSGFIAETSHHRGKKWLKGVRPRMSNPIMSNEM